MDVQTIGSHAFMVYINSKELKENSLLPRDVDEHSAKKLLSSLIDDGTPVSIESYPGQDELLIFVRRCAGRPEFYRFDDFNSVLAAAHAMRSDAVSSLYSADGGYVLAVYPWNGDDGTNACVEFGDAMDVLPDYDAYLAEHGKLLISDNAFAFLQQIFDR